MLNRDELRRLIHLEHTEADTLDLLGQLTPERVTPALFSDALSCLQETALPIDLPSVPVMDCCGTGGSGLPHFNTSTTVAFILAAAGIPVIKFGNRGFSSQSGSFDLLAQLGFSERIDLQQISDGLEHCGLLFLFAPQCYPQLAAFNQLRRTLKTRTLFNFLGPLLNPVKPAYRLLGVSHPTMQQLMADYLASAGDYKRGWIVHGQSGLDEIETHHSTHVFQIEGKRQQAFVIAPPKNGHKEGLSRHNPSENLEILTQLFKGEDHHSPYYQMVCLNAGAGLLIAGKAHTLEEGVQEAQSLLRSGKTMETLEKCRRFYEQFSDR